MHVDRPNAVSNHVLAIRQGFSVLSSEVEKAWVWANRERAFFQLKVGFIYLTWAETELF
jgi:hypothetical protein